MRGRATTVAGVALFVLAAATALWLGDRALSGPPPGTGGHRSGLCAALDAEVPGVDEIRWANGITVTSSRWMQVLGDDGLAQADGPSRARIAAGVAADGDGFDRLRSSAPSELRPALDRLRALALDPDEASRRAADPDVSADITAVARTSDCGWAP